jgi:hypothetical protein
MSDATDPPWGCEVTVLRHLDNYDTVSPVSHSAGSEFDTFMQRSVYRQPWAPAIPSTLGTSRPAVYQMAQSGAVKSDDAAPYAPRHARHPAEGTKVLKRYG